MSQDKVVEDFHKHVYEVASEGKSWGGASYFGVKLWKWPCDLHNYQELIYELRPALIIETGTAFGGSALYFAHLLDQIGSGKVLSIDLKEIDRNYPLHPRIAYWGSRSSVDPQVIREVTAYHAACGCPPKTQGGSGRPCLVVLDSDHSKAHVLRELEFYSTLVSPNSWLVVEDTNLNGHPVYEDFGPGPQEALEAWLPRHSDFKAEVGRQTKYLFSMHTWLRRMRK